MTMYESIRRAVSWLSDRVNRGVEGFLFVIGFGMAMLIGVQVFCRYGLNHSLFWSEEIGRICLVWISFLGATAAYKRKAHIGIDVVVNRLPERAARLCELIVLLLSSVFFVILLVYGVAFIRFVWGQKTAALGINQGIPYMALPLSGALFLLHTADRLLGLFGDR